MSSDTVFDQLQDKGNQEWHRLSAIYATPEYVKQASELQRCGDPESLPPAAFADVLGRRYPQHSKAATWVSSLYLFDKQGELTPAEFQRIRGELLKSALFYHMQPTILELEQTVARTKLAGLNDLTADDFAIVWDDDQDGRHWPLRNAREVKAAAELLVTHRGDMSYADRCQAAEKILSKSASLSVEDLPHAETLQRMAGRGIATPTSVASLFQKLASFCRSRNHADLATRLDLVATKVLANPASCRDISQLTKLAHVIGELQATYQTVPPNLCFQEDVLFAVSPQQMTKLASCHLETATGAIYAREDLERISPELLQSWLGSEFTKSATDAGGLFINTTKLANALQGLTASRLEAFEHVAAEAGVQPVFTRRQDAELPLSRERLLSLAR